MIYDRKIKLSFTYIQNIILSYIYIYAWICTCGTFGLAFPALGL